MIDFIPQKLHNPKLVSEEASAWGGIPEILKDIIDRFRVEQRIALEFGVQFGYSTSALANYFEQVIAVDTFLGDINSGIKEQSYFDFTKENLKEYKNIKLLQMDFREFIKQNLNDKQYDLIHIDIIHDYANTFECGEWAVNHSNCVIFHDTESFKEVKDACQDLVTKYNLQFHNFKPSNGLGILIR